MALIRLAGMDGSLQNFGVAKAMLDTDTMQITVLDLLLVKTAPAKDKKVRSSSDYLARSLEIRNAVHPFVQDCLLAFVEVPSGGQDFKSVMGFGIVVGTYAGLPIQAMEVSPAETKMAACGSKNAEKKEIVQWAVERFPDAAWRTYKRQGQVLLNNDNEHLADGVAIIHAGIRTPAFQQVISILRSQAA